MLANPIPYYARDPPSTAALEAVHVPKRNGRVVISIITRGKGRCASFFVFLALVHLSTATLVIHHQLQPWRLRIFPYGNGRVVFSVVSRVRPSLQLINLKHIDRDPGLFATLLQGVGSSGTSALRQSGYQFLIFSCPRKSFASGIRRSVSTPPAPQVSLYGDPGLAFLTIRVWSHLSFSSL
jgi:hypothetical protein